MQNDREIKKPLGHFSFVKHAEYGTLFYGVGEVFFDALLGRMPKYFL